MDTDRIPYILERMTPADVPAVASLEKLAFSLPWSVHAFDYEVRYNPMAHFLVLSRCDPCLTGGHSDYATLAKGPSPRRGAHVREVLGYGGFWLFVDEAHICTLAVHPHWRGRGLGELLLVGLINRASELNANVATLEVRASNIVAQSMYQKYGFAIVGLRKGYYSDDHEDALIMTTERLSSASFREHTQRLKALLWQRLAASNRVS